MIHNLGYSFYSGAEPPSTCHIAGLFPAIEAKYEHDKDEACRELVQSIGGFGVISNSGDNYYRHPDN